jgi:hypothetical protein
MTKKHVLTNLYILPNLSAFKIAWGKPENSKVAFICLYQFNIILHYLMHQCRICSVNVILYICMGMLDQAWLGLTFLSNTLQHCWNCLNGSEENQLLLLERLHWFFSRAWVQWKLRLLRWLWHQLRASACKNGESQVKWKYSNFFLFHQINPFSVPTMEKILKSCCDLFFVRFLQNPDFAGNEVIFMLEPADI